MITVFVLISFVNIINLIDGLDGLSSGIVAIASLSGVVVAISVGSFISALIFVALFATCLAFLFYNRHPAKIFMGDAGAMALGMVLGIASIVLFMESSTLNTAFALLLPMAIPIIDTFTAIVRRIRLGTSIGNADKSHLHHRLLTKRGHSGAVRALYLTSGLFTALALGVFVGSTTVRVAICAVALAVSIVIIREFRLLGDAE